MPNQQCQRTKSKKPKNDSKMYIILTEINAARVDNQLNSVYIGILITQ